MPLKLKKNYSGVDIMKYSDLANKYKEVKLNSPDERMKLTKDFTELGMRIYYVWESLTILFPLEYLLQCNKLGHQIPIENIPSHNNWPYKSYVHVEMCNIVGQDTGGLQAVFNKLLSQPNGKYPFTCVDEDKEKIGSCFKTYKEILKEYKDVIEEIRVVRNKYFSHIDSDGLIDSYVGSKKFLELIVRVNKIFKELCIITETRLICAKSDQELPNPLDEINVETMINKIRLGFVRYISDSVENKLEFIEDTISLMPYFKEIFDSNTSALK